MDTESLKAALEDAGLSPYQIEAYVAILELGAASATEIANACDVPDPRIYDVLRSLEADGYVETYEQDSLHARAHSPAGVLEDLRARADRFEEAAEEIERRWDRPEIANHSVSIVKRFETVLDRAAAFVREAENQVQASVTVDQYRELRPALAAAFENGVVVKLSLHTHPEAAEPLPAPGDLEGTCTEARHRDLPAPFVVLVDRNRTCFSPHADSVNQYGVIVEDRSHAYVFHWFFLAVLWERWETVYSAVDDGLPATYVDLRYCVRDIEPLLAGGATVTATVRGEDTTTGESLALRGTIRATEHDGAPATGGDTPLAQLAGEVYVVLDTGDREYTIGGWGATLEDLEATRITIEDVT